MRKMPIMLSIIACSWSFAWSQNLMVTPRRVVFEERIRSAEVTLINRSTENTTYRISFTEKRMTPEGSLEPVDKDQAWWSANKMIRFAPRQVVLQPGESQQIRLLLRKPADLKSGEYRSHLVFRALPDPSAGLDAESLSSNNREIGIKLTPVYGISIPIIVRQGDLKADVSITRAAYIPPAKHQPAAISLNFKRLGEASVYGDIQATYHPEGPGKPLIVAKAHGMAIYPDVDQRSLNLDLLTPEGMPMENGRLIVSYKTPSPHPQILATSQILLPSE